MRTTTHAVLGSLILSTVVLAQTRPAFEVASIRPSSGQPDQVSAGVRITGSQVRVGRMSLKDFVGMAYRVKPQQIEGPDWLGQQRFDVAATIPDGASMGQIPEMFQTLLDDRFQLKMHREMKEFPVYVLGVAASGLKIKESPPAPQSDLPPAAAVNVAASATAAGVNIDFGGGASFALGNNRVEIRRMAMASVAEALTRFFDRPVVDMTGLSGRYDLTLDLTAEDYMGLLIRSALNAGVVVPPQALRMLDSSSSDPLSGPLRQAGLTLESRKAPLDVIVVDSASKTPTEN
jgi:uncharacterized protein (TIGR03435 family)